MKTFLAITILYLTTVVGTLQGFSQSEPIQNYEHVLTNEKLKSIKTILYKSEDTIKSEGQLLFSKEFNDKGNLIKKYVYTFWDVVSYDHTTTYKYDLKGNLLRERVVKKMLNLGKRDADYIAAFGMDTTNKSSFFTYNNSNQLVKELHYSFLNINKRNYSSNRKFEFNEDKTDLLAKEKGKTPNGQIIYQDYEVTFEYDIHGNRIKQTKKFNNTRTESLITTTYLYNEVGQVIEKQEEHVKLPSNNSHWKYEYDSNGNKIKTLIFSEKENDWNVRKTYSFDKNGHPILGDDQTTFIFYENGLIKRELWKSNRSDEMVNFITTYKFY